MSLQFNENGRFRVLQITDTHFGTYPFNENDQKTFRELKKAIEKSQADLLVFTGDIVYSMDEHGAENPDVSFREFVEFVNQFEIPTAVTFGNHDSEEKITRHELREIFDQHAKYPVTKKHADIVEDRESYVIEIKHHDSQEVERALYVIDSGDYSGHESSYYAWVLPDQVRWFSQVAKLYQKGDGVRRHVVFQHIPLLEHWDAGDFIIKGNFHEDFEMNLKWAESSGLSDAVKEKMSKIQYGVSSPELNSGLFLEMVVNDETWGMLVGHDHDNNYEGLYKGVVLGFGQSSGYNSYGSEAKGVKVIDLLENGGVETDVILYEED